MAECHPLLVIHTSTTMTPGKAQAAVWCGCEEDRWRHQLIATPPNYEGVPILLAHPHFCISIHKIYSQVLNGTMDLEFISKT